MIHNRVAQIAKLQDGLITRRQALAAGMTPDAWRHATRSHGPWQRVLRGIHATFTGPVGDLHRLRAATLHAGPAGMITGAWGCWMHGLTYGPARGDRIVVLVPHSCRRDSTGFVLLKRCHGIDLRPHHWVDSDAAGDIGASIAAAYGEPHDIAGSARPGVIPMAPAERAVIDTLTKPASLPAEWHPRCTAPTGCPLCRSGMPHRTRALRNTRALMCEVVQRGLCTIDELAAALERTSRNNTSLARAVLADITAGCRSAPECELRDLIATSTILPEPRWNQALPGARGVYPDACWPEARLVVEVDSRAFHGFGDAPERTERRRARYAALGWSVLPVAPRRIREEPIGVLGEIEAAYRAGRRRRLS